MVDALVLSNKPEEDVTYPGLLHGAKKDTSIIGLGFRPLDKQASLH